MSVRPAASRAFPGRRVWSERTRLAAGGALTVWIAAAPAPAGGAARDVRAGRPGAPVRPAVLDVFALPLDRRLDGAEPKIEVRFSAPMDETSFEGRVELLDATGAPVPVRWVYDAGVWSLRVSPVAPVPADAELVLRLRDGIVSAEGDTVRPEPGSDEGTLLTQSYRSS
jgi:hypothetical protein